MFIAVTSGAAAIVDESTLIPLGIFCVFTVALVGAAWKVSASVTRAVDRMESVEERLRRVEDKLHQLNRDNK